MGRDQPSGELLDIGILRRHGQGLHVAGTVEQLALEREITEKGLVERFGLLGQRLDRRGRTAQERTDHIGEAAEVADRLLDGDGAGPAVLGVLGELAAYRVGARLRDAGLGDLDLSVGQVQHRTKLGDERGGGRFDRHGGGSRHCLVHSFSRVDG
ncbi:uncharacterized protein PO2_contig-023-129 [Mycobacterium sp. PO2]|nr:uncharacterized protein PO2_contig-023-129 [Mycobacterium sp. PO2]